MTLQRYLAKRPNLRGVILTGGNPSKRQWSALEARGVPRQVLADIIRRPPSKARLCAAAKVAAVMGLAAVSHRWAGKDLRTIAVDTSIGRVQVTGTPDGEIVDAWPPGSLESLQGA